MPFRKVRKFVSLVGAAVKTATWAALKALLTFLFEPTYRVRGHVHVSCDSVRVDLHHDKRPRTPTEVRLMAQNDLPLGSSGGSPGKMRGARPTPRHKLAAAFPFKPTYAYPAQFAYVPAQLSMWGNSQYGDCVSAEEAFAKACNSPEIFIPENTVIAWARQHGFLNGADLGEVMDAMAKSGFPVSPNVFNDGPYQSVDFSTESVLQAAIATGPVKIGIDADALPSGAGNSNGWYSLGGGSYRNEDHCVSLCGYGPAAWLFQQLGVPLPSSLPSTTTGYLLFTWSTIGFVSHQWIMGTCGEAWVRNPTTIVEGPTPTPTPTPTPVPVPPTPTPSPVAAALIVQDAIPPGAYNLTSVSSGKGAVGITIPPEILTILQWIVWLLSMLPPAPAPSGMHQTFQERRSA
jgi:hypothetical protein